MNYYFSFSKLLLISLSAGLFFIFSCAKENSQTGTDAQEQEVSLVSGESDAEAETIFNEFFDHVMGVNNNVGVGGSGVFFGRVDSLVPVARCFTVTVSHPNNTPFPATVVIDFGTVGCPGPDGRVRKGKIITEYTNRLIIPGATATTTFDRFFVDSINVDGTHKITNISDNPVPPSMIARKYKVEVINGKLSKPNGNYTEWNCLKTITQIEGLITPDLSRDDVFKIEGSANGKVRRGNLLVRWESGIFEPLIRRFTCRWIVRGKIKVKRANLPINSPWTAILDFGNGICDNLATLTINGVIRQITLP